MAHYVLTASSWLQDAIDGFNDLVKTHAIRKAKRAEYKQTVRELNKLTNFELNDIGICRGDIHNIASGDRTLTRGIEVNPNLRGSI